MSALTCTRTFVTALLTAAALVTGAAGAQQGSGEPGGPQAIETFTPPRATSLRDPRYPGIHRRTGQEGWVQLTFMVSPTGEPYDVAIVDSSGDERFDQAALNAVAQWAFAPAMLGDRPIDAGMSYLMTFALTDNAAASPSFVGTYRDLMSHIQAGDRQEADRDLAELESVELNLYEAANLNLAAFSYHQKWGTPNESYQALRRATVMRDGNGYLPDDLLTSLLKRRFALELELNHFADARHTGEMLLARDADPQAQAVIEQALSRVDAVAGGDQPIPVAGRIGASSRYFHRLLRNRFHFQDIDGHLAELRLHCERDYVGFTFNERLAYTLSEALGACGLQVIGTPGTTFTLVEIGGSGATP